MGRFKGQNLQAPMKQAQNLLKGGSQEEAQQAKVFATKSNTLCSDTHGGRRDPVPQIVFQRYTHAMARGASVKNRIK